MMDTEPKPVAWRYTRKDIPDDWRYSLGKPELPERLYVVEHLYDATALRLLTEEVENLKGERDELRREVMGGEPDYANFPSLSNGNFIEMVRSLHAACDGGRSRAEASESEISSLRQKLVVAREALEWALNNCTESDHPHYPYHRDGKWGFPYLVSNAGGFGGGVGEVSFDTAVEATIAAINFKGAPDA